ncbi:MAG TPA: SDR family oxidoreductase [Ilumatobacteraceae bacterium]|nr:SDR family oxidoreductase [Ilumatobacteraceae bacterium]
MGQLDGRTIVITGGNGGIGLGMAQAVGAAGARVVIWGRNADKNADALATLASAGVDAHALICDVASEDQVESSFAASVDWAGGRIDSLVANAGRGGTRRSFVDTSLDQWRAVMATNLDGVFLCFRAAARHMIEGGHGGALVAVSSTSAIHGAANNEAYGTSKTALLGMVRGLAVALARHHIRVNALLPGWTLTDLAAAGYADDKFRNATVSRTPVRRWADPSEMGPAAVFLTDPALTFHTGDTMTVDGGYTIF